MQSNPLPSSLRRPGPPGLELALIYREIARNGWTSSPRSRAGHCSGGPARRPAARSQDPRRECRPPSSTRSAANSARRLAQHSTFPPRETCRCWREAVGRAANVHCKGRAAAGAEVGAAAGCWQWCWWPSDALSCSQLSSACSQRSRVCCNPRIQCPFTGSPLGRKVRGQYLPPWEHNRRALSTRRRMRKQP